MAENNIEWGARGEIEFNIKSNLNKKLLFRQAVLYTFGQDCSLMFCGEAAKPKRNAGLGLGYARLRAHVFP